MYGFLGQAVCSVEKGGYSMKKIGICLMVVLSFVMVGGLAYNFCMSSRYSVVQFRPSDMTAEEIKAEFPEIAFSPEERTLCANVMELPEVRAALAAGEETIFTKKEGETLLEAYLTKDRSLEEFYVSDEVYVRFRDTDHQKTTYTFDGEHLSKEISVYEKHPGRNWDCVAVYKNLNGKYEKIDGIPQWFSWRQLRGEA